MDDGMDGDETAGDGIYTFVISDQNTAKAMMGEAMNSVGLLAPGERLEFVWVDSDGRGVQGQRWRNPRRR